MSKSLYLTFFIYSKILFLFFYHKDNEYSNSLFITFGTEGYYDRFKHSHQIFQGIIITIYETLKGKIDLS